MANCFEPLPEVSLGICIDPELLKGRRKDTIEDSDLMRNIETQDCELHCQTEFLECTSPSQHASPVWRTVLSFVALRCPALHCVALRCAVLHCVVLCCTAVLRWRVRTGTRAHLVACTASGTLVGWASRRPAREHKCRME